MTCAELRAREDALERSGFAKLILDPREVTFIDSSGVKLRLPDASRFT